MKKILEIRKGPPMHWVGDGFAVRSMFSYDDAATLISPFLLLDYAAPREFPPSEKRHGVGEHPHRGFETVTIVYQGEVEHRDSAGNHGKIGPGDVQWMTAASGVVHEEMHGREFTKKGGMMEMVQLWVNLPRKFKMSAPKYQDIYDRQIPAIQLPDNAGTVRVIAGEFNGEKGPAHSFTPIHLWDLTLKAKHRTEWKIPEGHNAALLVRQGKVLLNGSKHVGDGEIAFLDRSGENLTLETEQDTNALLLSGQPIDEAIEGYGPFVMNTEAEIRQAIQDYQSGRMGHLT